MALVSMLVVGVACGDGPRTRSPQSPSTSLDNPLAPGNFGGSYNSGTATGDTQAGADFARWVLDQDPQRQYMTDAVVRNEQVLGIKVNPQTTKADVQRLMEALAIGMAKTFPGKPLTINAFYQSGDKLAEARYDPDSNRVAVQFAQ
jgi:hypothetical protein